MRLPFIRAGHDGWDGKNKKIFRVSIFLVHPGTLEIFRIPVALVSELAQGAKVLCETTLVALKRVGVEPADIFRSVNDNCTTAIATGRR